MKRTLCMGAALLALTACASEPTFTAMVEMPQPEHEEDTSDVVGPWGNPIKMVPGQPDRRSVSAILKEANDSSLADVRDGQWQKAKLRFRWEDGTPYKIVTAKNRVTSLKLFPGEGYVNHAFGDDRHFGLEPTWAGTRDQKAMPYGPAQTSVPVIPWEAGKCTDLTIYTTWREIMVETCSVSTQSPYNRSVEWWMPGEELRLYADALKSGEVAAPTMEPATGVPMAQVQAKYKPEANPDGWASKEWLAFHNGKKTYVIPPVGLPFTPVPVVRNAGGSDTPSFRSRQRLDMQGSYFEIDALPPEILMAHGSEMLTLRRVPN
jgi:hypothetical protein